MRFSSILFNCFTSVINSRLILILIIHVGICQCPERISVLYGNRCIIFINRMVQPDACERLASLQELPSKTPPKIINSVRMAIIVLIDNKCFIFICVTSHNPNICCKRSFFFYNIPSEQLFVKKNPNIFSECLFAFCTVL